MAQENRGSGARDRRIRAFSAGVLLLSGAVIGCTLGRLSVGLLPPSIAQLAPKTTTPPVPLIRTPAIAAAEPTQETEAKGDKHDIPQTLAPSPPPVVLLNPGAVAKESLTDPATKSPRLRSADTVPQDSSERRRASEIDDDRSKTPRSGAARDYRSLREDMIRR